MSVATFFDTMDYLAYYYFVNESGSRFRKAVDFETVGGIRFVKYDNYRADTLGTAIERYDEFMDSGHMTLVSQIEAENIVVTPIAD